MHKLILATALAGSVFTGIAVAPVRAATVPCEDMQKQLETALQTKKPADADKARFDELRAKGDERCKSEDDRRADEFYQQALVILGK